MLPGPDEVLQCPACEAVVLQPTISSGNTFGATYYTDGFVDAPMLPQPAHLVRCPACARPFMRRRAQVLGRVDRYGSDLFGSERAAQGSERAWWRAPRVATAQEVDYVAVLATQRPGRVDELDLRVELMHRCNHARRKLPPHATRPPVSALEQANLRKLAAVLDLREAEERVMLAEVRRELGEFDLAERLLAEGLPEDVGLAACRIRQLAAQGQRWVAEITAEES